MRVEARDGTRLAVHDLGGDGPPVLLAHATGFHGLIWDGFADALARSFRVWSFDVRGHGASDAADDMSWATMADDLLTVIDALGLETLFGFGHSLGGALLVIAEATRPRTFPHLYLYEPAILPPMSPRSVKAVDKTLLRRRCFASRKDAYENYASKPPLNELAAPALWAYVEHGFIDLPDGTVTLACTPESESRTFAGALERTAWNAMDVVACPITLGHGDGPGTPGSTAEQVAHLRATDQAFPGLGHFGPLAEPELVAKAVVDAFSG